MTTRTTFTRAISTGSAAIALAVALASCSSGSTSAPAASSSATRAVQSPTKSTYSSQLRLVVSESANGTSLTVNRGADVIVTLHNTYWMFKQVSAPKVLVEVAAETKAGPPGSPGVPGSGDGTVRETYQARAAGTAVITASRTTCGEALRCTPAQSSYRITVLVR
jgi:hypothetical protein